MIPMIRICNMKTSAREAEGTRLYLVRLGLRNYFFIFFGLDKGGSFEYASEHK